MARPPIRRVVVLEGSAELREAITLVLQDEGFEVWSADNAPDAWSLIALHQPDVVLTEIVIRRVPAGLELLSRIRAEAPEPKPAVVVCSGFRVFEEAALAHGADVFVAKPVDAQELLTAVKAAAGGEPAQGPGEAWVPGPESVRQRVLASAAESRARLGPVRESFRQNCQWAADWAANYLGFGRVAFLWFGVEQIEILAISGDPSGTGLPGSLGLAFARDVIEAQSSMVLTDARRLPSLREDPHWQEVGLFVGLPVFGPGGVALAALCVFDRQSHAMEPEAVALLEELGRRGGATLTGAGTIPMFAAPHVLSRVGLEQLLELELTAMQRRGRSLELAVLLCNSELATSDLEQEVLARPFRAKQGLARLDQLTLALFLGEGGEPPELPDLLGRLPLHGVRGAGFVLVASDGLPAPGAGDLVQLAQQLACRGSLAVHGRIDGLRIRSASWALPEAATLRH